METDGNYESLGSLRSGGKAVGGGGVTVRHKIEKGLGLQSISNRQPLQVLEDGIDKKQPSFRTRNPRVERSGLKWHGI